jgi:hypothetical protein
MPRSLQASIGGNSGEAKVRFPSSYQEHRMARKVGFYIDMAGFSE